MRTLRLPMLASAVAIVALATCLDAGAATGRVVGYRFSAASFNPSSGRGIALQYALAGDARLTIRIVDPDGGLVRVLVEDAARGAGKHREPWDGRDLDGRVVPDEAYTAIFESSGEAVDPDTGPGGEVGDVATARFDAAAGTIDYELPAAARVLIRCGIHDGPMLKTVVDWKPRVSGAIREYWDGRDEDGLLVVPDQKGFAALITYVTLPRGTVIAFGNAQETYRDYKRVRGASRPVVRSGAAVAPGLDGLVPPAWRRTPRVALTLLGDATTDGTVTAREAVEVRVDVDPEDRAHLLSEQFEVMFFVDNVFFGEAERGYLPLNWRWELQQLPPGDHVLTVNVASFSGQVGVASGKVRIPSAAARGGPAP